MPRDLFKSTTADENDGLGGSVGGGRGTAVPRAATSLTWATAATERVGPLETCIFIEDCQFALLMLAICSFRNLCPSFKLMVHFINPWPGLLAP